MINTKCKECMFSASNDDADQSCSKGIIEKIKNIKKISKDEDNFNVIENYACRYGFSKEIYEKYKTEFEENNFALKLEENSKIRYYLLLDCSDVDLDFRYISQALLKLKIPPKSVSFMFRNLEYRPFNSDHQSFLTTNYKDIVWKAHNFIDNIELENAIDNILSTNSKSNNTCVFLVYNAKDLDSLEQDVEAINIHTTLYQSATIAMIDNNNALYRLSMSFENYKVAKTLGANIISVLNEENNIIHY